MDLSSFLEIRTLIICQSVVLFLLAISMINYYYSRKTYEGFGVWTIGIILFSAGFFLIALRSILPNFVSVILANLILIIAIFLMFYGFRKFERRKVNIYFHIIFIFVLSIVLFPIFTYISPNINSRVLIASIANVFYFSLCILSLINSKKESSNSSSKFLIIVLALFIVLILLRSVIYLLPSFNITNYMDSGVIFGTTVLGQISLSIVFVIGLIQLNAKTLEEEYRKVIHDLELSIQEIKTIKGLIPICSYCHSIRDEKGLWERFEKYISTRSSAEFSHGICPICFDKEMKNISVITDNQ